MGGGNAVEGEDRLEAGVASPKSLIIKHSHLRLLSSSPFFHSLPLSPLSVSASLQDELERVAKSNR